MEEKYNKYIEGTKKVLEDNKKDSSAYIINILNKKFLVLPNVFSPKYFNDTKIFASNIKINPGEDFLEIGPGTGVISIFAALNGAKSVTAIDINPQAVKNTKENAKLNNVENRIKVLEGDVYSPLNEEDTFDTIFWNTPFGYVEEETTILEKSVFDKEYASTKKFITQAKNHLKDHGRLLIGFSTTLGKFDIIEKLLHESNFKIKLIVKEKSQELYPVFFELFEATLIN